MIEKIKRIWWVGKWANIDNVELAETINEIIDHLNNQEIYKEEEWYTLEQYEEDKKKHIWIADVDVWEVKPTAFEIYAEEAKNWDARTEAQSRQD